MVEQVKKKRPEEYDKRWEPLAGLKEEMRAEADLAASGPVEYEEESKPAVGMDAQADLGASGEVKMEEPQVAETPASRADLAASGPVEMEEPLQQEEGPDSGADLRATGEVKYEDEGGADNEEPQQENEPQRPQSVDEVADKLERRKALAATMQMQTAAEFEKRSITRESEREVWQDQAASNKAEKGKHGEAKKKGWGLKGLLDKLTQKEMREERKAIARGEEAIIRAIEQAEAKHAKDMPDFKQQVAAETERVKMARERMADEYGATSDENVMLQGARVDAKGRELNAAESLEKADEGVTSEMRAKMVEYVQALQHPGEGKTREEMRKKVEGLLKRDMANWRMQLKTGEGAVYLDEQEFMANVDEAAELFETNVSGVADAEDAGTKELQEFLEQNFQLTVGRNIQMGEVQSNIDTRTGKLGNWAQKLAGTFGIPTSGGKAAMVAALAGPGGARMAARFGVGAIAGITLGAPVGAVAAVAAGVATGVAFGRQRGRRRAEKTMIQSEMAEGRVQKDARYKKMKLGGAIERLEEFTAENGLETEEQRTRAVRALRSALAMRQLHEKEGYAVFNYNGEGEPAEQRNNFYQKMGELEELLCGEQDPREFHARLMESLESETTWQGEQGEETGSYLTMVRERLELSETDKVVHAARKHSGRMGAAISAASSMLLMGGGSVAGSALHPIVDEIWQNIQGNLPGGNWAHGAVTDAVGEWMANHGMHEASLEPGADGSYSLMATGENGEYALTDTRIGFGADNAMWADSKAALEAEGFRVDEIVDWNNGNYIADHEMSVEDYLAGHENVQHLEGRSWDSSLGVETSDFRVGEGDDLGYYVAHVSNAPEGAEFAISLNEGTQSEVVTYTIDANGNIRIPMDDPVAYSVFEPTGRGDTLEFTGAYGEVMTVGENGAATVLHTEVGSGVETLQVPEKVPSYQYILERGGQYYVIGSPKVIANAAAAHEGLTPEALNELPRTTVMDTSTGQQTELHINAHASEVSPHEGAGASDPYAYGASLYEEGASNTQMAENMFAQVMSDDGQLEALERAFGAEGMGRDEFANFLTGHLSGAEIGMNDLSMTPNIFTTWQMGANGTVMPQMIDGGSLGGHALTFMRDGQDLLNSIELRDWFGIPHDAAGHFAIRLDCGGQIVWIPDQATPEILENVTEAAVPVTPTAPAPAPEPLTPEPTPEPGPEPEPTPGVVPKGPETNAGPNVEPLPVTPEPQPGETYVEANQTPEAGRVTGVGDTLADARTPEQAAAAPNPAPSDTSVTNLTDEDLANEGR